MRMPRYPVYVISKGRHGKEGLTARFLLREGVPFRLVVEPQEADTYRAAFPAASIEVLPFSNLGQGSIPARNWCWEDAKAAGHDRHWILDDNISGVRRWFGGKRIACGSGPAFSAIEDFADRYLNAAICGMDYTMLSFTMGKAHYQPAHPFDQNVHVYSCILIDNTLPFRWRGRYNEDTDLCLQALAHGMCTVLTNAFTIDKTTTMTMKGGNATELYQGDGRLKMARSLERMWPGVVTVGRRYGRPQHVVNWRKFDTPLRLKPGVVVPDAPDEYGMRLVQVAPVVKSAAMRELLARANGIE